MSLPTFPIALDNFMSVVRLIAAADLQFISNNNEVVFVVRNDRTVQIIGGEAGNKPSAAAELRGCLWVEQVPSGNDNVQICLKKTSGAYQWYTILTAS